LGKSTPEDAVFRLNRDYLYGSYFFFFLAERYGPDAVPKYVEASAAVVSVPCTAPAALTGSVDELWLEYRLLNARLSGTVGPRSPKARRSSRDWYSSQSSAHARTIAGMCRETDTTRLADASTYLGTASGP